MKLRLRDNQLRVFSQPAVMGIINVTPDSFFNPHRGVNDALMTVQKMVTEGADIIDIGGEATNPAIHIGLDSPSVDMELERVIPVIAAVRERFDILISVDTSEPAVMQAAVAAGADIINDQRHLSRPHALTTVAALKTPVCLMHFFTGPAEPTPALLLKRIIDDLSLCIDTCIAAGITADRIILDPGFGQGNYGKNADENFYLLAHLSELTHLGFPILSGWSRKSMIADTLGGVSATERLFGSIAADTVAVLHGAMILRTHDVRATADAAKIAWRVKQSW